MNDSKLHMAVAALLLAVAIAWSAVRGPSRDPYDELVSRDRDRVASARFMSRPVADEGSGTEIDQVDETSPEDRDYPAWQCAIWSSDRPRWANRRPIHNGSQRPRVWRAALVNGYSCNARYPPLKCRRDADPRRCLHGDRAPAIRSP